MNEDPRVSEYLRSRQDAFGQRIGKETHHIGGLQYVAMCPFCGKARKLYVAAQTGLWDCKSCAEKGNLTTLKRRLGDIRELKGPRGQSLETPPLKVDTTGIARGDGKQKPYYLPPLSADTAQEFHRRLMARSDQEAERVWDWLVARCLTRDVVAEFVLGVAQIECAGDSKVKEGEEKGVGGAGGRLTGGRRGRVAGRDHVKGGEGADGRCELCGGNPRVTYCVLPIFEDGKLTDWKWRAVPPWPKGWRRAPGARSVLYHTDQLDLEPREDGEVPPVILVEGEWDVMAMRVMGYANVTTVPTGAGARLRDDWADKLARATQVFVCYDQDRAGRDGAVRIVEELGRHRCWLVELPTKDREGNPILGANGKQVKDANDFLVSGMQHLVADAFDGAKDCRPDMIVRSDRYYEEIQRDIRDPSVHRGLSTGWAAMDMLWGGIRPAEMTILTGHSGTGKTTWSTMLALNLVESGIPGVVFPSESRVKPGVRKCLRAIHGADLAGTTDDQYWRACSRLDELPLYWLDHWGQLPFLTLKETIRYSVARLGIEWALLDHLGYFVTREGEDRDRWEAQERVLKSLLDLCAGLNLHIIVVAHPKSTEGDETTRIQMTHLKGGSEVWQCADNIISLHLPRTKSRREKKGKDGEPAKEGAFVSVLKNRSETAGREGEVWLDFDRQSGRFRDPT